MIYKGEIVESVAPAVEPITLAEVQNHLRVSDSADDALIEQLIVSVRSAAVSYCARSFINTTWVWYLDAFENEMFVPIGSMSAVSSIKYIDTDAALQTLVTSVYQTDFNDRVGRIVLDDGQNWPDIHSTKINPIQITYVAGFGAAATDVPAGIKDAILRIIGTLYE